MFYEKDTKGTAIGSGAGAKANEGNFEMTKKNQRGLTLNSFLVREGIHEELKAIVAQEAISWQLKHDMKKHITKKNLPN
jgi:hypothetical protein